MSPVLFLAPFSELRLLGPSCATISVFLCFITSETLFRKSFLFSNCFCNVFIFRSIAYIWIFSYIHKLQLDWTGKKKSLFRVVISDAEKHVNCYVTISAFPTFQLFHQIEWWITVFSDMFLGGRKPIYASGLCHTAPCAWELHSCRIPALPLCLNPSSPIPCNAWPACSWVLSRQHECICFLLFWGLLFAELELVWDLTSPSWILSLVEIFLWFVVLVLVVFFFWILNQDKDNPVSSFIILILPVLEMVIQFQICSWGVFIEPTYLSHFTQVTEVLLAMIAPIFPERAVRSGAYPGFQTLLWDYVTGGAVFQINN